MKRLGTLVILGALLPPARSGESLDRRGKTVWQHSQASRMAIDSKGVATTVNHRYLVNSPHRCFPNDGSTLVVSQRATWRIGPFEGNDPKLEATAIRVTPDGKHTTLWTKTTSADEGRLQCDYYETIWYGCCSAMPNHRLYHPATGRLLMEHSGRLITVEVPNSPLKRFIGYKPVESQQTNPWEKHKRHIGTLTYASPEGILQRVAIRSLGKNEGKYEGGLAKIQVKRGHPKQEMNGDTLRLWHVDGTTDPKSLGPFSVVLTFSGAAIELPVQHDGFVIPSDRHADHEIIRLAQPGN